MTRLRHTTALVALLATACGSPTVRSTQDSAGPTPAGNTSAAAAFVAYAAGGEPDVSWAGTVDLTIPAAASPGGRLPS
ncbi:hypothetical protein [Nocardioides sp. W7]|uniref:hypothetical protein n=1 Tax=Nocardioides sp. W7 TaxID=2931390 RepID=UPI001FD4340E|nr:hypothetical protein [Nocardioides sp. W7]